MLLQLLSLLKNNKDFSIISLATLFSGIGTALTVIAVYGELSNARAQPFFYSVAFILSLFPGLFSSALAAKLSAKIKISTALILAECCGAIFLVMPMIGVATKVVWFLLVALFMTSAVSGFQSPIYQTFIRRKFKDEELKLVSICSVYIFSANFIFGEALGTVLYPLVGTKIYLFIDLFSYLLAAVLIFLAYKKNKDVFNPVQTNPEKRAVFLWKSLNVFQKRAFLLTPFLALCCAPAMSLLPAIGAEHGKEIVAGSFIIAPALVFLLFKTLGQIIGPFVANRYNFDRLFASNGIITALLMLYLGLYYVIYTAKNLTIACLSIVLAHIASNIVYILASYSFTKHFDESVIAVVSARHYQVCLIAMCLSGLWAGIVAEKFNTVTVIYVSMFFIALTFLNLIKQSHKKKDSALCESPII
ncbi:MAG: MFS transporter [Deltaproteobacteria bacterium]|nr:MFS transporter [Deltaproteobacteria bacterium]